MKKVLSIVGVVVLVLIGVYAAYRAFEKEEQYYATLDINPQIEFILNDKYEVNKIVALNEDASIVIEGLELIGLPLEEATRLVIVEALRMGYIDEFGTENYITVTAYNNDEEVNKTVEDKIIDKIKNILDKDNISYNVVAVKVNDELKKIADQKKISYGKLLLVERAYSINKSLDKEKLMKSSIREIQKRISESIKIKLTEKELKNRKEDRIKANGERIRKIIDEILRENDDNSLENPSDIRSEKLQELLNKTKEKIKEEARDSLFNKGNIDLR